MNSTAKMSLPLLQPSQAQKHVTVNEALARLDALAALTIVSCSQAMPPATPLEGDAYGLPDTVGGAWAEHGGGLALFLNEGWVFVKPQRGWRAWVADEHAVAVHDGNGWRADALAISPSGAASCWRIREFDHVVSAGSSSSTAVPIPANVMVLAVTARVIAPLTGTLATWRLGVSGATDRFGAGLGTAAGSFARGLLSSPMSHYSNTPLRLGAEGGSFTGGTVRIAIHHFDFGLPGL